MHRVNARLSQRIAEEAQLLAEEKWIIGALRIVKQQRNGLQIERLHLENLKATVNKEHLRSIVSATDSAVSAPPPISNLTSDPPASESVEKVATVEESAPVTSLSHFDVPVAGIDDEMCNNEKLNLSVTDSVFTHQHMAAFDMEEDEDDLENCLEDEEDMENCLIEMNMLMQANPSHAQRG